jgi:hypothetical protein
VLSAEKEKGERRKEKGGPSGIEVGEFAYGKAENAPSEPPSHVFRFPTGSTTAR